MDCLVSTRPGTVAATHNFYLATDTFFAEGQKVLALSDLQVCVVLQLHVREILITLHKSSLEGSLSQKSVWTLAQVAAYFS